MKHFLIIQTAFIGDVILATPVVSELKRIYPDSQIDFLVKKGNESLLKNNPKINKVFVFNKKQGKFKQIIKLRKELRKTNYDEVINLHRFGSSGIITLLTKAKAKIGFHNNPFSFCYSKKIIHEIGTGKHEVSRNLSTIAHHRAKELVRPELFPTPEEFDKVIHLKAQPYYCLAPASVWFTKAMPVEKWVELGKHLSKKGKVYLLGGPDDKKLCASITSEVGENIENLAGQFSFNESAALMKDATMNYVNDSGPMHFASAVNASVTAIFCSTIPAFGFGPLSDNSTILEPSKKLSCRPCGLHGYKSCPKGHFDCGYTIEIIDKLV